MDPESGNTPPLSSEHLSIISHNTIAHYDENAGDFWDGTKDHDVRQNTEALLTHMSGSGPYSILDFGCGPGRDLMYFTALGHKAVGLDGSGKLVALARMHSGCEVLHQDFLNLDLPLNEFDGVFANASLFHVPRQELSRILSELWQTLKPGGILFSSNPRGNNQEGFNGTRFGSYHSLEAWRGYISDARFEELTHYYRPKGMPRDQQPWLAMVARKVT